jgi:hypothetical protein
LLPFYSSLLSEDCRMTTAELKLDATFKLKT